MGKTGNPWGILFFTGFELPLMPSTHIAALHLFRKFAVHLRYSSGIYLFCISERRCWWFTKSKKPLISKVSADVTMFWFQAVCTSCTNVMAVSQTSFGHISTNSLTILTVSMAMESP